MAIACVAAVIVTALAAHGTGRCPCNRCPLGNRGPGGGAAWSQRVSSGTGPAPDPTDTYTKSRRARETVWSRNGQEADGAGLGWEMLGEEKRES